MSNATAAKVADLTSAQREALAAIAAGQLAWCCAEELTAGGHSSETMASLAVLGLTVSWDCPEGPSWTLTPWGAWTMGVAIAERVHVSAGVEVLESYWYDGPLDEQGPVDVPPPRVRRHAREVRLPFPGEVIDPAPGPEYLIDEVSEAPVMLWGTAIRIDPRLARAVPRPRGRKGGGRPKRHVSSPANVARSSC